MRVLPCEERCKGSQKCCLGPKFMEQIGAGLGTFIKVHHLGKAFLCQAWPRDDLLEDYMQYDGMVTVQKDDDFKSDRTEKSIEFIGEGCIAKEVSLSIVLSELKTVKKCKGSSYERARLSQYVKETVRNVGVSKNCSVDCSELVLGQMYKINFILINGMTCDGTVGLVKDDTLIKIDSILSLERYKQRQEFHKMTLGGLEGPSEKLREIVELPFHHADKLDKLGVVPPSGVLLQGPPGCGKTSLVKQTAISCDAHLVVVNSPEIFGSRPGEAEENLRRKFETACDMCEEGACILFIDEVDSLCPKRGKGGGAAESRLVSQLGALMDSVNEVKGLIVVAATNRPNQMDPSLRRPGRFDREIFIGIPNAKERGEILSTQTSRMNLSNDIDLSYLADITKGYVGADLVSICQEVSYKTLQKSLHNEVDRNIITMEDFLSVIGKMCPSTQRGSDILTDYKPVLWQDIGGLAEVKVKIQQAVEWPMKHPEAFARLGIPRPKGVLLYGPPGCCKTTLVKAAATACKATFLSISGAQLFSPFVGDSERKIAEVFQQARAGAPSLLFFDEIDSIVGKRSEGSSNRGVQERVLSTLLNYMDGIGIKMEERTQSSSKLLEGENTDLSKLQSVKIDTNDVLVVAATNRPDMLDDALLRPGRIDRIIYVPAPDEETRMKILEIHTKKMPTDNVNLRELAEKTELFTGADLENLCREAALRALTEDGLETTTVKQHHFLDTLNILNPSLSEELLGKYKEIKLKSSR